MPEWLPEISDDDLETLVEALEAWESKDFGLEMLSDLLEHAIVERGTPNADKFQASQRLEKQTRDKAKKVRKERSIVLRAKLLTLRDRRRVDQITTQVPI